MMMQLIFFRGELPGTVPSDDYTDLSATCLRKLIYVFVHFYIKKYNSVPFYFIFFHIPFLLNFLSHMQHIIGEGPTQ